MNPLAREALAMHNPGLGAIILWRFVKGYSSARVDRAGPPLPLAFLVLPMVWHAPVCIVIEGTQTASGLRKFADKFTDSDGSRDILLAIHDRAVRWRPKTKAALQLAFACGLLGLGQAGDLTVRQSRNESHSNSVTEKFAGAAETLGIWFSAMTPHEIGLTLHVDF